MDHYQQVLLGDMPPPLRINVDGEAGTGKSWVILQGSIKLSQMASAVGKRDPVIRSAPTGVAAYNLLGRTLHSPFRLPIKGTEQDISTGTLKVLQTLFADCNYLIIDMKSMIDLKMLALIDARLREIFPLR